MTTSPNSPADGVGLEPGVDAAEVWESPRFRTGLGPESRVFEVPGEGIELATLAPPLLDRALVVVNRDVVVVAGGTRIDGRLVAVDEDALVLTVDDKTYRHFIDLQSVAVLAVER